MSAVYSPRKRKEESIREGTIRGNNETIDCIESTSMYKSHVYEQKKEIRNSVKDCESGHDIKVHGNESGRR